MGKTDLWAIIVKGFFLCVCAFLFLLIQSNRFHDGILYLRGLILHSN